MKNIIILAAGRGSRLAPLTDESPKALIKINGKPILESLIEKFQKKKFNVVLITGYKFDKFKYLEKKYNIKILLNKDWKTTSSFYSAMVGFNFLKQYSYVCNADSMIEPRYINFSFDNKINFFYRNKKNSGEWSFQMYKNHFDWDVTGLISKKMLIEIYGIDYKEIKELHNQRKDSFWFAVQENKLFQNKVNITKVSRRSTKGPRKTVAGKKG